MFTLILSTLLLAADPAEVQPADVAPTAEPAAQASEQPGDAAQDANDAPAEEAIEPLPEIPPSAQTDSTPLQRDDLSEIQVQVLDGDAVVGRITKVTDDALIVTGKNEIDTPVLFDDILTVSPRRRTAAVENGDKAPISVDLTDGSVFSATDFKSQEGRCTASLDSVREISFDAKTIRRIRMIAPTEDDPPEYEQEWTRLSERESETDILVACRDGKVSYHFGFVRDVTVDKVQFEIDQDVLPVPRGRVLGLIFRKRTEDALPASLCKLSEADGSTWSIQTLTVDEDRLGWTTPQGIEGSTLWQQIGRVDFSQGKILFLSDMTPESAEWTPYFEGAARIGVMRDFFLPRQDQNLRGGLLTLDDEFYFKGVSIHSRTDITYRLPDRFSRFRAVIGIDDAVRPAGHVTLRILGDGRELHSSTVSGKESARTLDLDVSGVRRLKFEVGFGEAHDHGDMLDLCNARVIK